MSTPVDSVDEGEPDTTQNTPVEEPVQMEATPHESVATTFQTTAVSLFYQTMIKNFLPPEENEVSAGSTTTPSIDPSRSPEEMLADLKAIMMTYKNISPLIPFEDKEVPISALPANHSGGTQTEGPTYKLKDISERRLDQALTILDQMEKDFAALDSIQKLMSDFFAAQTSMLNDRASEVSLDILTTPSASIGLSSSANQTILDEEKLVEDLYTLYSNIWSVCENASMNGMRRVLQTDLLALTVFILYVQKHLATLPEDHVQYPFILSHMCTLIFHQYELKWEYELLKNGLLLSIKAWWKWSDLSKALGPELSVVITSAAVCKAFARGLRWLTHRDGETYFIEQAVSFLKFLWDTFKTLPNLPSIEANGRAMREELAMCLLEHYRLSGDLEHLNESIEHFQVVGEYRGNAGTTIIVQPVRANLGMAYLLRFLHCGDIQDLDHALNMGQMVNFAVSISLGNNDDAATSYLMAMALFERFKIKLETLDLEKAIKHCRNAIYLLRPRHHPLLPQYRASLALLLYSRYEGHKSSEDLQSSLEAITEAVSEDSATRIGSHAFIPVKAVHGYLLCVSGENRGDVAAIENGIRLISRARKDYHGPLYLESHIENYLSKAFCCLFTLSKDKEALVSATHHASLAFEKALDNSPHRFKYALDLGNLLLQQYLFDLSSRCDEALALFRFVSTSSTWPSIRLEATIKWANTSEASYCDSEAAQKALSMALDIIPSLASLEDRMTTQHKILSSQTSTVPNRAAAYAIEEGDLIKAIQYLEKGRNIMWAQALNLRFGNVLPSENAQEHEFKILSQYLSNLRYGKLSSVPSSADQLEEQARYDPPDRYDRLPPGSVDASRKMALLLRETLTPSTNREARFLEDLFKGLIQYKELYLDSTSLRSGKRWYELLSTLPDLQESLLFAEQQRADLLPIVIKGPIVVISAHGFRCDAIIINTQSDAVDVCFSHLPLPGTSGDELQAWAETLRQGMNLFHAGDIPLIQYEAEYLVPILRGLWKGLALPILDQLGYTDTGAVKRIWWYPTGPLMFLPIHAASPCEDNKPGLLDFIISSYTPSIHSLIRASKSERLPLKVLAVGVPDTPGMPSLRYASKEIQEIRKHFRDSPECLVTMIGEDAKIYPVLKSLTEDYTALHFTCHAYQNEEYPFNSAFFLHNGPLKLSKLMDIDLSRVQFAFLSACFTSRGDTNLPDECINLAAAMQFAGVRSVVATLSSVDDRFAAGMASKVYQYLLRNGIDNFDPGETSQALFEAIKEVRKRKIPLAYVCPYIHLGF